MAAASPPEGARAAAFILHPGRTCWKRARADRVAFLVDGEEIFGAMAEAMERARRSILLVGWDFHSGVRLRRGEEGEPTLVEFLNRLVARRPELHVEILEWDFSMIYALEREPLPALRFGTSTHERVHFELDGIHPPGASHHLKLVVVDDATPERSLARRLDALASVGQLTLLRNDRNQGFLRSVQRGLAVKGVRSSRVATSSSVNPSSSAARGST